MIHFIYHWIYEDFWVLVWPNWAAGAGGFYAGYLWKGKKLLREHREHQKKIAEIHDHLGLTNKSSKLK
jgi:hypothetical protein